MRVLKNFLLVVHNIMTCLRLITWPQQKLRKHAVTLKREKVTYV